MTTPGTFRSEQAIGATLPLNADSTASMRENLAPFIHAAGGGLRELHLMVENVHCGGCLKTIEREIGELPDVEHARLNLTTRRLAVRWVGSAHRGDEIVERLTELGYPARPYDPSSFGSADAMPRRRCCAP